MDPRVEIVSIEPTPHNIALYLEPGMTSSLSDASVRQNELCKDRFAYFNSADVLLGIEIHSKKIERMRQTEDRSACKQ